MKQSSLDLNLSTKKTRKQELLAQMDLVVSWAALVELIAPYYPEGKNGRPPFALETMVRIHCMQQWFDLSDQGMEEAFFDTPIYREFAGLDAHGRMPDESTILRFRHRLEKHRLAEQILATVNDLLAAQGLLLKAGTAVDATLIAAPSSTKNKDRKRDPEMHSSQKGNEWHFGMKAHIGVDADSGLVHTVIGTSGNVADVVEGNSLLHGQEKDGFGDAGYQGVHKRPDAKEVVRWHIAMRPGKRKALDKENNPVDALIDQGMLCTNAFELCFPSPRSQSQGAGGGFRAMTPAQTRIHAVDKGRRAPFRSPHARCTRTLPIASSLCLAIHRLPSANSVTICSVFFFRPR